jgi:hypothetical protein
MTEPNDAERIDVPPGGLCPHPWLGQLARSHAGLQHFGSPLPAACALPWAPAPEWRSAGRRAPWAATLLKLGTDTVTKDVSLGRKTRVANATCLGDHPKQHVSLISAKNVGLRMLELCKTYSVSSLFTGATLPSRPPGEPEPSGALVSSLVGFIRRRRGWLALPPLLPLTYQYSICRIASVPVHLVSNPARATLPGRIKVVTCACKFLNQIYPRARLSGESRKLASR